MHNKDKWGRQAWHYSDYTRQIFGSDINELLHRDTSIDVNAQLYRYIHTGVTMQTRVYIGAERSSASWHNG